MSIGIDQESEADPMQADEEEAEAVRPADCESQAQPAAARRCCIEEQHQSGVREQQQRKDAERLEGERTKRAQRCGNRQAPAAAHAFKR